MKKKINIQLLLIAGLAIVATSLFSIFVFYSYFRVQIFEDLKTYTHVLKSVEQVDGSLKFSKDQVSHDLRITMIDKEGTVIYDSSVAIEKLNNHKDRPEIEAAFQTGEGKAVRWSDTLAKNTFYYAVETKHGNIIRISKETSSILEIFMKSSFVFIGIILSIFILCVILGHFLTLRLVRPIEKMAENIGMLDQTPVYSELEPFVKMIKEQHANLLSNSKMREEFTANVSHELKTPLTAISGYAELISAGMTGEQDTIRFAQEIHQCANHLVMLINDIIKLSELDETLISLSFEEVDLYQLSLDCAEVLEFDAKERGVTIYVEGNSQTILGNRSMLEEIIINLSSNAIRYNNIGGEVRIIVDKEGENTILCVKDTGIGISKEHQERIFERFYRVDKSRSKSTGGTGLGLAIVKHIVVQHDAQMSLISEVSKGTEITICFLNKGKVSS